MESFTKAQRGSPSRDKFKWLHKQMLPKEAYALDVDLELIEKWPFPFVAARLDFKMKGDTIGFTEALSYQRCIDVPEPYTVPVYIVEAEPIFKNEDASTEMHRFTVYRLVEADYKPFPPTAELEMVAQYINWDGLREWEMKLRAERRAEMKRWLAQAKPSIREQAVAYVVGTN